MLQRSFNLKKRSYIFKALVLNPIILIIYGTGGYYLSQLASLGGVNRRLPVIVVCFALVLFWFLSCLFLFLKFRNDENNSLSTKSELLNKISEWWYFASLLTFTTITLWTGYQVHYASVPYQGKLAWVIEDYKNTKEISFVHTNIYDEGLDGLFRDIQSELELPEELYMSDDFRLTFDPDGEITSLNTFLYGKNADRNTQTFLISYDRSVSSEISVIINGSVDDSYDEAKKLEPLVSIVSELDMRSVTASFPKDQLGIVYTGYRDWGSNSEGIYFLDNSGYPVPGADVESEYAGYTVSIYVPYQEDTITPKRIIDSSYQLPNNYIAPTEEGKINNEIGHSIKDGEESYFLTPEIGFKMPITDAATGDRYYALEKTMNNGTTWERVNQDVFYPAGGGSAGLVFFDEELGFAGLSHEGGSRAELYRTEDGGITFEKISLPKVEVELSDEVTYPPYDYPGMPYAVGEQLLMMVGQGVDGDYNGGDEIRLVSNDQGRTWQVDG